MKVVEQGNSRSRTIELCQTERLPAVVGSRSRQGCWISSSHSLVSKPALYPHTLLQKHQTHRRVIALMFQDGAEEDSRGEVTNKRSFCLLLCSRPLTPEGGTAIAQ